jgi:hypothetical protein
MSQVVGILGFSEPMAARPKFHANDTRRDVLNVVPRAVPIEDARQRAQLPSLDIEGFCLRPHASRVRDFRNPAEIERVHGEEIRHLLLEASGADQVEMNPRGVVRFAERSPESGTHDNSRPARFVHVDVSDAAARQFYERARPDKPVRRAAQYNAWRVLTPPPQDVPLALCDARSVTREELIAADAVFDKDEAITFSFEAWLLRHDPRQRWAYFSNMDPAEVLIFKTHDTQPGVAHCVPHGAFDDPGCPAHVDPRASIEMRGIAYWFA